MERKAGCKPYVVLKTFTTAEVPIRINISSKSKKYIKMNKFLKPKERDNDLKMKDEKDTRCGESQAPPVKGRKHHIPTLSPREEKEYTGGRGNWREYDQVPV